MNEAAEKMNFKDYFKSCTGKDFDDLKRTAELRAFVSMEKFFRRKYEEYLNKEPLPDNPDFNTWLKYISGHTCGELYEIARATGPYRSYEKMIEWYKNRYIILFKNPFVKDAVTSGNGENYAE